MLKILIISDAFWPDYTGGITKSLLTEIEGLVTHGHQIVIVTRRLKKNSTPYERRDGYEVYRYPSPPKGSILYWTYPFFSLMQLPKLVKEMQISDFDVVYIHNPFQMLGLQRVCSGVPTVYTFHAPMLKEVEIERKHGKYGLFTPFVSFAKPVIRMVEQKALHQAKVILIRSQFMKEEMHRLYRSVDSRKIEVVPLAVDTARFKFANDPKAVRKSLGLPEDRKILLTVRRVVGRMGLENLIDAMKLVTKRHPEALLLIGGKGYLEGVLQKRIRSQELDQWVKMLGFIPEEELPLYYQAADLFVLPTVELEGFGLATIEALSCGTPVIATPIGANPEVVAPLGSEFLCKDVTAKGLAERINWWLTQGISAEVRQACREYCVSRFAVEAVVASLEDIFIRAIKMKGGNDEYAGR